MKKLFKRVSVLFAALMALSVSTVRPVEEVKAAATDVVASVDFTTKSVKHSAYTDSWKYSSWTVSGGANNNGGWAYVKMGGKSSNLSSYNKIYIASPVVANTSSKVTVNVIAGSIPKSGMSATINLEVYSDSSLSTKVDTATAQTVSKTAKLFEFVPSSGMPWPANSYYKVVFNCTNTSTTNGIVWLDNVSVYGADESGVPQPIVSITGDDYTQVGKQVTFTETHKNVDGTATWTSSDTNVATIDSNGVVTPISMGKTTIKVDVNGTSSEKELIVYPVENSNISIADAIEVCKLTDQANAPYVYSTTGTIESIDTAYDSSYGNITVTITDGTNSIKAFRMKGGSELSVGAKITVTGTLVNYYGNTPEFIAGCTYVTEQTNEQLIAVSDTKFSLSFDYSLSSNANDEMVDFTNQGYTNGQAISEYVGTSFNVSFAKGGNTNNAPKYYDNGTAIRLYANNEFTVTSDSTIVNITFGFGKDDSADNVMTPSTGSFEGSSWTGSANEIKFTLGDGGQRRFVSILVTTCDGELQESASFANVNLAFGASVNADLFEGYASVNGGILLENAANYTETTLAEAYANGSFEGIDTIKENLTPVDGFYTVGTVVEIINGLVNEENEKFLSYEFVAAAYFELVDAEGNVVTTVVLQQKVYSVKSMIEYYNNNLSLLGIEDKNVIKALGAFEDQLA